MSFICAVTKKPSLKGEKPTRLVVETRPKVYKNIVDDEVITSYGEEIVREVNVSAEGMQVLAEIKLGADS